MKAEEMTPSQAKAINSSDTMHQMIVAQRLGAKVVGKTVRQNDVMNWLEIQVRTEDAAYDWKVTPRGRIVEQRIMDMY